MVKRRITKKNRELREALASAYSEMVGKDISPTLAYRILAVTFAIIVESTLQADNTTLTIPDIGRWVIRKIAHKTPNGSNQYKDMGIPYMPILRFFPCDSIKNYIVKTIFKF